MHMEEIKKLPHIQCGTCNKEVRFIDGKNGIFHTGLLWIRIK